MQVGDLETPLIPKPFQKLFPKSFNIMQKQSFHDIWNSDTNLLVQAPTGSGKTVLAKMAFLKGLLKPSKVLYVGPLRALNDEKGLELKDFEQFSWNVQSILGGTYVTTKMLEDIDLVLTTPEKLLSLLHTVDINHYSVIVIDEIHLLGEEKRGAYLEFLLMELLYNHPSIRIIGLSATIPNTIDLAIWLRATPLIYNQDHRATSLVTKVIEVNKNSKDQLARIIKAYQISKKFLPEQVLLFTTSRANVQYYAKTIGSWLERDGEKRLEQITYNNKRLTDLSVTGVAFFHAGLQEEDKRDVISNYKSEKIKILVATSSLAWGVNLPAMAVIITDMEYKNPLTGPEPMSSADILQMLGRAGRPQYHDKGYGYILTNDQQRTKIEAMLEGTLPITSALHEYIAELLLHYMALESSKEQTLDEIMSFFELSFLVNSKFMSAMEFEEVLERTIIRLRIQKLLVGDDTIQITPYGIMTSRFFVHPNTAGNLLTVNPQDDPEEIVPLVTEFNLLTVRRSEKKFLRSLGATPKTYRDYKLLYVIKTLDQKGKLEPEFIQDGIVIYKEYMRIYSFYNYLKKIVNKKSEIEN
jgi:replicative superfamily II helicase